MFEKYIQLGLKPTFCSTILPLSPFVPGEKASLVDTAKQHPPDPESVAAEDASPRMAASSLATSAALSPAVLRPRAASLDLSCDTRRQDKSSAPISGGLHELHRRFDALFLASTLLKLDFAIVWRKCECVWLCVCENERANRSRGDTGVTEEIGL